MTTKTDKYILPENIKGKKVVLVNHSDTFGEAAMPTFRLMQALRREGVDARMVVFTRNSGESNISYVGSRFTRAVRYSLERMQIVGECGMSSPYLFNVSTGRCAINVHDHPWVEEADIVCLNWINQGLMNLKGIRRLHRDGKKIIWSIHDQWAFTGICHQSYECDYFTDKCGNCMFIKGGGDPEDISHRLWVEKARTYDEVPMTFVADSKWLETRARSSSLLRNQRVLSIPNPMHVNFYYTRPPQHVDTLLSTTKPHMIIMGANRLDDKAKGLEYAIDALNYIFDNNPEIATHTAVYLFGDLKHPEVIDRLRMSHRWLGRINDQKILRYLYSSAKVVLSTAITENISDTVIEGMASGAIPVVFGGDSREELITHLANGYVAHPKDVSDIANGIMWALQSDISREELHDCIVNNYSSQVVARKYIELFSDIISN